MFPNQNRLQVIARHVQQTSPSHTKEIQQTDFCHRTTEVSFSQCSSHDNEEICDDNGISNDCAIGSSIAQQKTNEFQGSLMINKSAARKREGNSAIPKKR